MRARLGSERTERGFGLIGLLVVVLIIAVGIVFMYGRSSKTPPATRPGGPTTRLGQGLEQGKEVDCANNLRQIRTAILMKANDEDPPRAPASLNDLRSEGIGAQMLACPVTKYPYRYDPATGKVWCVTPGHERF